MLVRSRTTKIIKVMAFFIDPWKEIDFTTMFDEPENIFLVEDSNLKLSMNYDLSCMSLGRKIKRIYMLSEKKNRTLII